MQTAVVDNSTAFGFSITITGSFGLLTTYEGSSSVGEVFAFALAAALAFGVLQAAATKGFAHRPDIFGRKTVMLGTALDILSVGLGLGGAALAGVVLSGFAAWPVGGFLAGLFYVGAEAIELAVAARLKGGD